MKIQQKKPKSKELRNLQNGAVFKVASDPNRLMLRGPWSDRGDVIQATHLDSGAHTEMDPDTLAIECPDAVLLVEGERD